MGTMASLFWQDFTTIHAPYAELLTHKLLTLERKTEKAGDQQKHMQSYLQKLTATRRHGDHNLIPPSTLTPKAQNLQTVKQQSHALRLQKGLKSYNTTSDCEAKDGL